MSDPTAPNPDAGTEVMAMFPLGSVLAPSMILPLQVFEDRYRRMIEDVLASGTPEFGVVLIERGSEVGGGDVRVDVGCSARILDVAPAPDGRLALVCVGQERIRVTRWLDDDPYPRAAVSRWPDPPAPTPIQGDDDQLRDGFDRVEAAVRRVAALGSELGGPQLPEPLELSTDPSTRSHQLGVLSPLGPLDRLAVLNARSVSQRLDILAELLSDQEMMLRARLSMGSG